MNGIFCWVNVVPQFIGKKRAFGNSYAQWTADEGNEFTGINSVFVFVCFSVAAQAKNVTYKHGRITREITSLRYEASRIKKVACTFWETHQFWMLPWNVECAKIRRSTPTFCRMSSIRQDIEFFTQRNRPCNAVLCMQVALCRILM